MKDKISITYKELRILDLAAYTLKNDIEAERRSAPENFTLDELRELVGKLFNFAIRNEDKIFELSTSKKIMKYHVSFVYQERYLARRKIKSTDEIKEIKKELAKKHKIPVDKITVQGDLG